MKRPSGRRVSVSAYLLSTALLLSTGVTLAMSARAVRQPAPSAPVVRDNAAIATARDFYSEVNRYLDSGDRSGLDAVTGADFLLHPEISSQLASLDGLLAQLTAVRTVDPEFRLVVDDLSVSDTGDLVTARIHADATERTDYLGRALPGDLEVLNWAPVEMLRIVRGLVVERWSGADSVSTILPLSRARISDATASVPGVVTVTRATFDPFAEIHVNNELAARLFIPEVGNVSYAPLPALATPSAEHEPTSPRAHVDSVEATSNPHLLVTSQLTLPGESFSLENRSDAVATVLVVSRLGDGQAIDGLAATIEFPGIQVSLLATTTIIDDSLDSVAVGMITLRAGQSIEWNQAPGELIAIRESGPVELVWGTTTYSGPSAVAKHLPQRWITSEDSVILVVSLFDGDSQDYAAPTVAADQLARRKLEH